MTSNVLNAAVIDRMPIACINFSTRFTIESWNPAAERIFGWTADEILGESAIVILPRGFTKQLTEICDAILAGAVVETHVNENLRKDGKTIVCRWSNTPLFNDDGAVSGVLSMAEDITEEQQMQNALRRSEQRHRDLVNSLPHYIFGVDNENRYIAVNAAVCDLFGRSESEIIGRTAQEVGIPRDLAKNWEEKYQRTRKAGQPVRTQSSFMHDDRLIHVDAITNPIRDDDGEIIGVTGISIDVTEQKRAEEEARRLDERIAELAKMEALGTLAGGIAHDFNNILSIVLTHTVLLERRLGDERLRGSLETMKQAVSRGAAISRQILTFARRTELHRGAIDVPSLLRELRTLIAETFPRTIQITVTCATALPKINGDAAQLHQALLNLCINARDAMPDGGTLAIDARLAENGSVAISISDTGCGMDAETRRRIFEPFFTTKEKSKGTGLGLAMVYGIVNAHDAEIVVESRPAQGTTFRLSFPVWAGAARPPAPSRHIALPAHGERLLIIDDEPEILAGLKIQLTDAGYAVQTASNGADAIERLHEVPDLVLMDLGMPRMGAVELIKSIRAAAPKMPVVAMTGYVDPEVHAAVRDAGVARILQKPFEGGELFGVIEAVLASR